MLTYQIEKQRPENTMIGSLQSKWKNALKKLDKISLKSMAIALTTIMILGAFGFLLFINMHNPQTPNQRKLRGYGDDRYHPNWEASINWQSVAEGSEITNTYGDQYAEFTSEWGLKRRGDYGNRDRYFILQDQEVILQLHQPMTKSDMGLRSTDGKYCDLFNWCQYGFECKLKLRFGVPLNGECKRILNAPCEKNQQCASGYCSLDDNKCRKSDVKQLNKTCSRCSPCATGYKCTEESICKKDESMYCTSSDECESGNCYNGQCEKSGFREGSKRRDGSFCQILSQEYTKWRRGNICYQHGSVMQFEDPNSRCSGVCSKNNHVNDRVEYVCTTPRYGAVGSGGGDGATSLFDN